MQIAIMRTAIFEQTVLPVLKRQAAMNKQCLGDYVRAVLYKAFGYKPKSSNNSAHRMVENMANQKGNGKSFYVGVDQTFYYRYNIPGNMKIINQILAQTAGGR